MWISFALAIAVMLLGMLPMVGVAIDAWLGHRLWQWLQLVLSTPGVVWAGWPLWVRTGRSLATRHFNMFTLIGLGVWAAYLFSVAAVLAPGLFPPRCTSWGTRLACRPMETWAACPATSQAMCLCTSRRRR